MTRSTWLALVAVVAAGAAGILWFRSHDGGAGQASNAQARSAGASTPSGGGRRAAEVGTVAVVSVTVETGDFPVRKRAIGFVETPASVVVKSRLDSQVMQQHVKDGQFVKAGDLLFTLDDRDIRTQIAKDEAMLARDEATHTRNQADLARYQQLLAKNAGTQQSVDQATADERSSAATILADKATLDADRLKLAYTQIHSPIDGRVGAVLVTPGNLVSANSTGTGLVTVTQMKPLRVSFTLPERELPILRKGLGSGKSMSVEAKIADSDVPAAKGLLDFVDSSVDMASGTIVAKASFANDDLTLWPGQYVDVGIEADTLKDIAIVPTVAVQTGQKGSYVYVVKSDESVELRPVQVALSEGNRSAIREGLTAGERVVTDGQMRLKPGAKVRERAPAEGHDAPPVADGTPTGESRS